jgi:hypothetical protein
MHIPLTPTVRASIVAAVGLTSIFAILILLHDPPYPTPKFLGRYPDELNRIPWPGIGKKTRHYERTTPMTHLTAPRDAQHIYLFTAHTFLSHQENPKLHGKLVTYSS